MSQMFDDSFWGQDASVYVPDVDISEDDKQIKIVADVPGYDPEDIDITLDDNVLTLEGSMTEESESKDEDKENRRWYRKETASGHFFEQFRLPPYADESGIKCKAKNGKLTVTVPKKAGEEKRSGGKKLPIQTA